MKNILLFTLLALLTFSGAAHARVGGSDAGNGGGIAEKRLTFAYLNLERYLEFCLRGSMCRLSLDEINLLALIRTTLEDERRNPKQLQFVSGRETSDRFEIDGKVRIARTGDAVGSPILINTDLLYWTTTAGRQALDMATAVSVLVHELGHHHSEKSHEKLDILGSKVQAIVKKQVLESVIWDGNISLQVVQFNLVRNDADKIKLHDIDQVLIESRDQFANLTHLVLEAVRCPNPAQSIKGLRIYNLHEERGMTYDAVTKIFTKPLRAWYVLSCEEGTQSDHGDLAITLALRRREGTNEPEFYPKQSQVRQIRCANDPNVCL